METQKIPTCQVSIPNAYMSVAFVIRTVGLARDSFSSGALPRKKPTASLADHKSGREIMREDPNPVMRGVPSDPTNTFSCDDVSLGEVLAVWNW